MSRYVFLGPTLPVGEASALLDAVCLPPVRQGDLLRLVRDWRPQAVGIVDGYFREVPACWHKEVLFALESGVHVFGASSMGALRAAELDRFGMVGVGHIYAGYRDGRFAPDGMEPFEDDDEVAVVHGPAETGYVALSEAMVNIRATLASAAELGLVSEGTRDRLSAALKALFYPERSMAALLAAAPDAGLDGDGVAKLAAWLPAGRVDVKAMDARAMLGVMKELGPAPPPFQARVRVEDSSAWRGALAAAEWPVADGDASLDQLVLDEARLRFRPGDGVLRRAVERRIALAQAQESGSGADPGPSHQALNAIRMARGLIRQRDVEKWCRELDLDHNALVRLARSEARLAALTNEQSANIGTALLDLLRLDGDYPALRQRALRKVRALEGLAEPPLDVETVTELISWHALLRDEAVPIDLDAYSRARGFRDAADLARALWRERAARHTLGEEVVGDPSDKR